MTTPATVAPETATPILDSGVCAKRTKRKRRGATLFGFVLGLLFTGILIQSSNSARDARNPATDFSVVFYFLSFVLIIVVHEFGHLLAGWSVGFRFSFVAIGPLSLKVEYGRLGCPSGAGCLLRVTLACTCSVCCVCAAASSSSLPPDH